MLAALEVLSLDCPGLSFCEGVYLPPKLQEIRISTQKTTPPVTEWGFQDLTALSRLIIGKGGDDIFNTLMKESLLPISLVLLYIRYLNEMKSFDGNGLRHLSSLQDLCFGDCRQLESLPENCFPSSLKSLQFVDCKKLELIPENCLPSSLKSLTFSNCQQLKSLAEDSLPDSLERLFIDDCPLLEERYKRKEHWSKISHIPVIDINDEVTI